MLMMSVGGVEGTFGCVAFHGVCSMNEHNLCSALSELIDVSLMCVRVQPKMKFRVRDKLHQSVQFVCWQTRCGFHVVIVLSLL